jgi:hypothetical protein
MVLDEVTDQSGKVLDTKGDLAMTGLDGSYLVTKTGETIGLDTSFAAKSAALSLSGSGSEDEGAAARSPCQVDRSWRAPPRATSLGPRSWPTWRPR